MEESKDYGQNRVFIEGYKAPEIDAMSQSNASEDDIFASEYSGANSDRDGSDGSGNNFEEAKCLRREYVLLCTQL